MKLKTLQFLVLFLLGILLLGLGFLLSIVGKVEQSNGLPQQWRCPSSAYSSLETIAKDNELDSSQLIAEFPYQTYLSEGNYCNIEAILADLQFMRSLEGSAPKSGEIIMEALTTELEAKIGSSFQQYKPDSLIRLLHWADQFGHYANYPSDYQLEYSVIHSFWLDYIANKLALYTEQNSSVKHKYKFVYLRYHCELQQYNAPIGKTTLEKVGDYFVESKYSYLFNRMWNGTGWLFKIIVMIGLVFTIYAFYRTIQFHIKYR